MNEKNFLVTAVCYNRDSMYYCTRTFAIPENIPWRNHISYIESLLPEEYSVYEIKDRVDVCDVNKVLADGVIFKKTTSYTDHVTDTLDELLNTTLKYLDILVTIENILKDGNATVSGNGYTIPLKDIIKLMGGRRVNDN